MILSQNTLLQLSWQLGFTISLYIYIYICRDIDIDIDIHIDIDLYIYMPDGRFGDHVVSKNGPVRGPPKSRFGAHACFAL